MLLLCLHCNVLACRRDIASARDDRASRIVFDAPRFICNTLEVVRVMMVSSVLGVCMRLRLLSLVVLLAGLAFSSSGCLAVAVGAGAAGTVAYMRGDLEAEEPYGIEQTYAASREAVDELGLHIIEGESGEDALTARVTARDSSDKKVVVRLKAITSNATKVKVRVGTFGDEAKTRRIYSTIREHLQATAAAPVQPPEAALASGEPVQSPPTPADASEAASTSPEPPQPVSQSAEPEPSASAPDSSASPSP